MKNKEKVLSLLLINLLTLVSAKSQELDANTYPKAEMGKVIKYILRNECANSKIQVKPTVRIDTISNLDLSVYEKLFLIRNDTNFFRSFLPLSLARSCKSCELEDMFINPKIKNLFLDTFPGISDYIDSLLVFELRFANHTPYSVMNLYDPALNYDFDYLIQFSPMIRSKINNSICLVVKLSRVKYRDYLYLTFIISPSGQIQFLSKAQEWN